MKRHTPLTNWPRRESRHYRFALSNDVWMHKLKPIEFVILSYLCYRHSHSQTGTPTPEVIAKGVHRTAGTVKKHLNSLMCKGLITKDCTLLIKCENKNFFTLPNEIFLLNLPPSAFLVYAYLLLIEDRRTHTCHPSYNTIAAATGLARNTVISSTTVLSDRSLIAVEHSSYFDQRGMKWNGNHLYTILPTQIAVEQFHQRQLCQLELDAER